MSTKIVITYKKKDYTLEFSRATAGQLEEQGFSLEQLTEKPVKMIPLLFYGAFMKHNRGIKRSLVDEIFDNLVNKAGETGGGENGLLATLAEMYAETVQALTDDKTVDEGNAAVWKVTKA